MCVQRRYFGIYDRGNNNFETSCMIPGSENANITIGIYDTKAKVPPRGPRPFLANTPPRPSLSLDTAPRAIRERERGEPKPQAAMHFNYGTSIVAAGVRRASRKSRVAVAARARILEGSRRPNKHRSA